MHFNFPWTVNQVIWTLTFAAQLVLLVVLLGRDRTRRFPWFTASIALQALRLLIEVLLTGRLATLGLQTVLISLADLLVLAGLMVVAEMSWQAFGSARREIFIAWSAALIAVAAWVLFILGPWPVWKELSFHTQLDKLRLMQFLAEKADLFTDLLILELGLLLAVFGSDFKGSLRTHTHKIVIGLSTLAIATMTVQGMWHMIAKSVHPATRSEYEHVLALLGRMMNGNRVIAIVVMVWWIGCLWLDEPGTAQAEESESDPTANPVLSTPAIEAKPAAPEESKPAPAPAPEPTATKTPKKPNPTGAATKTSQAKAPRSGKGSKPTKGA